MRELMFTVNFEVELRYFRTQDYLAEGDGNVCCYGIQVEKYIGDEMTEEQDIGFVSESKEDVNKMICLLSRGFTTPFYLGEVVDEMVSKMDSKY
ncbi:MAG: DUF6514 family protein [Defluviitaleaceae bacterium]|nr:DUF6514 family protein [Defluviitaleaceae bacterium]